MEETKLLDQSNQKLKAILDGIGEGISIIDEELKIVWLNLNFSPGINYRYLGVFILEED